MDTWIPFGAAAVAFLAVALPRLLRARGAPMELVRQKLSAGATVVDVRTAEEFRSGAHPRAVNIPLQSLRSRLEQIPKDRPVVLYCASGLRSAAAARLLGREGFADVVNAGGLRDMPR